MVFVSLPSWAIVAPAMWAYLLPFLSVRVETVAGVTVATKIGEKRRALFEVVVMMFNSLFNFILHLRITFSKFVIVGEGRSEEHTSELQSLLRISYAVLYLKNTTHQHHLTHHPTVQYHIQPLTPQLST